MQLLRLAMSTPSMADVPAPPELRLSLSASDSLEGTCGEPDVPRDDGDAAPVAEEKQPSVAEASPPHTDVRVAVDDEQPARGEGPQQDDDARSSADSSGSVGGVASTAVALTASFLEEMIAEFTGAMQKDIECTFSRLEAMTQVDLRENGAVFDDLKEEIERAEDVVKDMRKECYITLVGRAKASALATVTKCQEMTTGWRNRMSDLQSRIEGARQEAASALEAAQPEKQDDDTRSSADSSAVGAAGGVASTAVKPKARRVEPNACPMAGGFFTRLPEFEARRICRMLDSRSP